MKTFLEFLTTRNLKFSYRIIDVPNLYQYAVNQANSYIRFWDRADLQYCNLLTQSIFVHSSGIRIFPGMEFALAHS